uniref:3-dehydroquinate synthase domain-containing protein n=1 Tax=Aureoumbra lagunensis TaxID=44058 RepID=A0A7S3NHM6_9STRA|mmetsp:Transcript_20848/g.31935  ORF Transcript_20848/g.31935 Transcript_20848/m.31935 type:complete len:598 (-) Transcript_20848:1972-3765(-)
MFGVLSFMVVVQGFQILPNEISSKIVKSQMRRYDNSGPLQPARRILSLSGSTRLADEMENVFHLALHDKRRVDEVVCKFIYDGTLIIGHDEYVGQGAIKRGLCRLFYDYEHFNGGEIEIIDQSHTVLHIKNDQEIFSFDLKLEKADRDYGDGPCLSQLEVIPKNTAAQKWLGTKKQIIKKKQRPLWETYDGRVKQKIWESAGLFDLKNTFLLQKLEISTDRLVCIIDQTVWNLYKDQMLAWAKSVEIKLETIIAPGNEDEKTMDNMIFLLDELARVDPLRRSEPVLAIGGGVLTDTAGFACALWRRGIPWCRLPTTLLGMVDASVGIKVAVNYKRKNGVGHFFSPLHTFIDATFLPTLDFADVKSGCGEIMKAALIHDASLFNLMEEHGPRLILSKFQAGDPIADQVVQKSIDAMLDCIGPDLWEESLLRPMDFGHTFSRTLEASEHFQLRHGEAVAIDCVMSTMIANVKNLVSHQDAQRVLDLYAALDLPCSIVGITADTYKLATKEITVHRDGILRAPLPKGIGSCTFVDSFTDEEIEQAFFKLEQFMHKHPNTYWDNSKSFNSGTVGPKSEEQTILHDIKTSPRTTVEMTPSAK